MSKTIVFKEPFESKLKELKIKTKFVKNFNNPKWDYSNKEQLRKNCLNTNYWDDFISFAFNWSNSPEGHDYWSNIENK